VRRKKKTHCVFPPNDFATDGKRRLVSVTGSEAKQEAEKENALRFPAERAESGYIFENRSRSGRLGTVSENERA